jgi:hypothetical protein
MHETNQKIIMIIHHGAERKSEGGGKKYGLSKQNLCIFARLLLPQLLEW